ncbi:hypothetical protein Tco_0508036 [Tanacetum coccineum]
MMDDPNITIEEYIRLEEEKSQKRGKVFNRETSKYGKIGYDEDIHDFRSIETEFPAIAFNDGVLSEKTLSCEPTVSSLNDEIDFRISFDDSDDEDYTCMTRSSTNELFTPFKDPEQEFRSSRKHFKTLRLDKLRSPDFNLFFDQENSEEEVAETMILDPRGVIPSKTVADAKVAIQEMAEYSQKWHNGMTGSRSTETSEGLAAIQAQLNNLGKEIKKVNEKVYAAQVGCVQCKGPHYTKDFPLKEEGKTLEEVYYTQFSGPFQGGGYRAAAPGLYQRNNANPSF